MHDSLHNIENSQTPVGFLGLPREIRDHIYEDTLDSAGQRPPKIRTIVAKNPIICQKGTAQEIVYRYHGRNSTPSISCAGLLGSNHQISDEMLEIIMRRNNTTKEGVQYKLHLAACHKSLLPTWLYLPAPVKYLRTLHVDLQLSTHQKFEWAGSVYYLFEISLQLLLRFFRCGPKLSEGLDQLLDQLPQQEELLNRMPYLDLASINLIAVPAEGVEMWTSAREGPHVAVADRLTFEFLGNYLDVVAASNVFRGKIKTVRLCCCQFTQEFTFDSQLAPDRHPNYLPEEALSRLL